jgi:hypothetical protein
LTAGKPKKVQVAQGRTQSHIFTAQDGFLVVVGVVISSGITEHSRISVSLSVKREEQYLPGLSMELLTTHNIFLGGKASRISGVVEEMGFE